MREVAGALRVVGTATQRAESQVAILREYRTRLIADVVTGRVDVREAAATLPDEGEREPDDDPAALDDVDETVAGLDDKVDEVPA